jgi:adapter protein MecA 1/2
MQVATLLGGRYQGKSALYKDEAASTYLLLLSCEGTSKEAYDRACNIISEYASSVRTTTAVGTFLSEHYEALIEEKAIESLGSM